MATAEGNGLEAIPYYEVKKHEIGWDPLNPLTWVPFGWIVKDQEQWSQWHAGQQGEADEVSPHSGLLERDEDWVLENTPQQDESAKGKFKAAAEKSTGSQPPTYWLPGIVGEATMHDFKQAIEDGDMQTAFAIAAAASSTNKPLEQ